MVDGAAFIQIWKQWDWKPGEEQRSERYLGALIALAAELDTTHMTLRRRLSAARRDGATYEDALEAVLHERL